LTHRCTKCAPMRPSRSEALASQTPHRGVATKFILFGFVCLSRCI